MKTTNRRLAPALVTAFAVALAAAAAALPARADRGGEVWAGYLDYAFVYASEEQEALARRLADYGREAGVSLQDYIAEHYQGPHRGADAGEETAVRRRAIAYLLDYLARGEPESLEQSAEAARELEGRLGRQENRYWYHYVLAHRALEKGRRHDFVAEILALWLHVVVPLETPYESLQTLSLSDSPNSGFVAALPHVYENVARIVLLRSQQLGVDRGLDPLSALVKLLADGRVGAHPDVIPLAASSKEYLDRIVERLDGPESDAGSLTFTLALFEASKLHERARGLLASEGLSAATIEAMRLASGAYETALNRADTEQGRCAVYTRVLRQLGEIFAAKQRLGVDPEIESPFSIEGAIEVYGTLHRALPDGWAELGYAGSGEQAFIAAMHGLWEEIQETTLNAADYYLGRALDAPHLADEHSRNAARLYARYLAFFLEFATEAGRAGVPDSAYFAAHEAARGVGDAFLAYAQRPTQGEVELATLRYRNALELFPFDRGLWPALTSSLERQGRETEYLRLVQPVAEWVTRSRSVEAWIGGGEPAADQIATMRRALADTQVLMYLGFAHESDLTELERGIQELGVRRREVEARLVELARRRGDAGGEDLPADIGDAPPVAAGTGPGAGPLERAELAREMQELSALLAQLDKQLAARTRALPLYREALATEGLIPALRAQRDHPVHTLLRRMYHEKRS
jgi:hypothetical protein